MSIKTDGLDDGPMPSGQVSPLRRSVRRSAAAATEKMRHGDDLIVNGHSAGMYAEDSGDESLLVSVCVCALFLPLTKHLLTVCSSIQWRQRFAEQTVTT